MISVLGFTIIDSVALYLTAILKVSIVHTVALYLASILRVFFLTDGYITFARAAV